MKKIQINKKQCTHVQQTAACKVASYWERHPCHEVRLHWLLPKNVPSTAGMSPGMAAPRKVSVNLGHQYCHGKASVVGAPGPR